MSSTKPLSEAKGCGRELPAERSGAGSSRGFSSFGCVLAVGTFNVFVECTSRAVRSEALLIVLARAVRSDMINIPFRGPAGNGQHPLGSASVAVFLHHGQQALFLHPPEDPNELGLPDSQVIAERICAHCDPCSVCVCVTREHGRGGPHTAFVHACRQGQRTEVGS